MEHLGKTFLFDYGQFLIRGRYLSSARLEREQLKGPAAGLKGEEEYGFTPIRPGVYFIWWRRTPRW
jgi:hypothetical protein